MKKKKYNYIVKRNIPDRPVKIFGFEGVFKNSVILVRVLKTK